MVVVVEVVGVVVVEESSVQIDASPRGPRGPLLFFSMGCVDGLVSVYTSPVLLEVFSDLENGELEIAPMLRRRRTNPTTTRTYDSQNLVDEKEQE